MQMRLLALALFLLAGYLTFGDYVQASMFSTPESFVADVGRGIGSAISGIASSFGYMLWG